VPRDQGALEVRQDGLPKADDAREGIRAGAHPVEQVMPQFLLDGAKLVSAGPKLPERADRRRRRGGWLV